MKAEELRIGNLVYESKLSKNSRKKIGVEICEIKSLKIHHLEIFPESKSFEPIPLTDEWLIKLGFKQKEDIVHDLYWSFNGFAIGLDFETWTGKFTYTLKYVHDLQNLYYTLMRSELVLC